MHWDFEVFAAEHCDGIEKTHFPTNHLACGDNIVRAFTIGPNHPESICKSATPGDAQVSA